MNKKVISIVAVVAVLVIVGVGLFLFTNRGNGAGRIDSSIQNENGKEGTTALDSSKVLVLYFSVSGNTQSLAKEISDQVGGDFRRIEPTTPYPTEYQPLHDIVERELDNNELPKFKDLDINIDDYDTIFIGYPIWIGTIPQIIRTFFNEYDCSGKTIIPFNTHLGSGAGGTYNTIKSIVPDATVLDGLTVSGNSTGGDLSGTVSNWLKELGY